MRIFTHKPALLVAALGLLGALGCRGGYSEMPPVHLNPNMDQQEKLKPQEANEFFADKRNMRIPPEGTVAQGFLREDDAYFTGKENGQYVRTSPEPLTLALIDRGQERYNIYCAVCHDRTGQGQGLVIKRGFTPPPSFLEKRLREMPDGQIYETITNGVRNMPGYAYQVKPEDRWAIVAWLRTLQRAQYASLSDVPAAQRKKLEAMQ